MPEKISLRDDEESQSPSQIAPSVSYTTVVFVNVYFVGVGEAAGEKSWVLIDTGLPKSSAWTRRVAEGFFGANTRPRAIILTHGHFDHAGSARDLADEWNVPIYAHRLEMPYLTGKSDYPPQDPTIGGALAQMSRLFPHGGYDFGGRVRELPDDGTVPEMPGWRWLHTPGHTAGHISLFREADRVLIAGDALATVNQESAVKMLITQERELRQPPAPFTTDWNASRRSIERLAELQPSVIAAGHGLPITQNAADRLRSFAATFAPPPKGRYVNQPARADERGVIALPPPVPDPVPKIAAGVALAAGGATLFALLRRRKKRKDQSDSHSPARRMR